MPQIEVVDLKASLCKVTLLPHEFGTWPKDRKVLVDGIKATFVRDASIRRSPQDALQHAVSVYGLAQEIALTIDVNHVGLELLQRLGEDVAFECLFQTMAYIACSPELVSRALNSSTPDAP